MHQLFWLKPDLIAGRPGPDLAPWQPVQLAAAGITAILSVNDAASVYADDLAAAGIEHRWLPLADNAPPRDGDFEHCIEQLPHCYVFLRAAIEAGGRPLVHCSAGKDRTGLVLAYFLCRHESLHPDAAIAAVRQVRPIAFTASGYEDFAHTVLQALQPGAGAGG